MADEESVRKSMEQMSLVSPGSGGREQPTLQVRLLAKRTDPVTSYQAPKDLSKQQADVLEIIRTYGPGTPWELAHRAWNAGVTLGKANVTEIYHTIERRAHELAVRERVRVKSIRPCTWKEGGRKYQEWEAWT